jgi:hypothetical protein
MTVPPPLTESCAHTLDAILLDPLEPGNEAETHMRSCRACSEARVAYLAQEDFPAALAPAGYFDRLPDRVLRKLPVRLALHHRMRPFTWAAAAALLLAVCAGAFWAGRANRAPLVEATLPRQPEVVEASVAVSDTPFHDREEDAAQIQTFTPDEMQAFLEHLQTAPSPMAR